MKIKIKENDIQNIIFGNNNIIQKENNSNSRVNFYDYDGKLLYMYPNIEFLSLNSLPTLPDRTNENLTCDGWNWTLSEIKNQINNVGGVINVGVTYHTTDGKTYITCKPSETYPQAYICLTPSLANDVTVDWGDGSTDIWSGTSEEIKSHTYTGVSDSSVYDITISCTYGTYAFTNYITGIQSNNENCIYTDIKLSNNVTSFGSNCFRCCYSLQFITIPSSVTSLSDSCFYNCYSLQLLNIPNSVTSLSNSCFYNCYSLQLINIPNNVTSFGNYCFQSCSSLQSVTIPDTATSLNNSCFQNCSKLHFIIIPNSVTSLGEYCFGACYNLQSIIIPNSVTSLGDRCFAASILYKVYMKTTTPPSLTSTNLFTMYNNFVIYIPVGTLSTYLNDLNWNNFSSVLFEYNY